MLDIIDLHREALSLFPLGHPGRPTSLDNLAIAILSRYERDGGEQDLADAIDLQREALHLKPPGQPDRSLSLDNLAITIHTRYERDGGEQDLSDVIDLHKEALSLRPLGQPNRSTSLDNLAIAIHTRYERDGREQDLLDVIDLHWEALSLRPAGHPDRSRSLNNLAIAIHTRYERDGEAQDVSDVIKLHQEALSLRPLGHPDRSTSLTNLAVAIHTRYRRDGEEQDLSDVIDLHKEALSLRPPGHPDHSKSLNNLAVIIIIRYERYGGEQDLLYAINLYRDAVSLLPPGHPSRSTSLNNLAVATNMRYERDGGEKDLLDIINLDRETLSLRPPGHPYRSESLSNLASAIYSQYERDDGEKEEPTRLVEIIELLQEAVVASTSPIPHRLTAALRWIVIAAKYHHQSALDAYQSAFTLMSSALALGLSLQDRHTNLLSQGTHSQPTRGLALVAALWALSDGSADPKLAVELLDQGRNVLLGSVGQFRADLSDVRRKNPALADEFNRISRQLDSAILTGQDILERKSPHEDLTNRYKRASTSWDAVVAKIRLLPDCESFLLPLPYTKLQEAAAEGPIIVILVGKERSTAIIVMSEGEPHSVDLLDASEDALKSLHEEWEDALSTLPDESRVNRKLPRVLSELWDVLVQPIIHELKDYFGILPQSRIWWYPTSWASFLPLHAAGSYKKNGLNVPDLYISSYTPTLQALSRARRDRPIIDSNAHPGLLMVPQSKAKGQDEIICVNAEVQVVQSLVQNLTILSGDQGTKVNVLQEMRRKSWIHFACHGVPDPVDPFQSHFGLHDNAQLSLQDIITDELPSAEFAYLSACHSAAQDRGLPDEGLTLAGGMQFVGFKSVVGTLWKMGDDDAPALARVFYSSLAKRSGDGRAFDCMKTAEALHDAVQELRKRKVHLYRWANLVHYGI